LADFIFLMLVILHIGFIVGWMGGGILFVSIINPAIAKISASSRAEFVLAVLPRYIRFVGFVSTGAVVAGVLLFLYITQVATSLAPSGSGLPFIVFGALLGLVALILATGVVIPTSNKLVQALRSASGGPQTGASSPATVIAGMQKRLRASASSAVGLLAITLILMVIGASN
jgi:uncharacterized membrane protein